MTRSRPFSTCPTPEARPAIGYCLRQAILLGILRFIASRDVWLAMVEASDFRETTTIGPVRREHLDILDAFRPEPLTEAELLGYHRQLFCWLLLLR